jgi:hypothetical protein
MYRCLVILLLLALVLAALADPAVHAGCFFGCYQSEEASKLEQCAKLCMQNENASLGELVEKEPELIPLLQNMGLIQLEEAVLDDLKFDGASSANPKPGSVFEATTSLHIREKPCTDGKVVATIPPGTHVTFTGKVEDACQYNWYSVKNSAGSGFAASKYLKPAGPGHNFPLFKQCDPRWKNDKLGEKTVCAIGCLMSSVSMALNGLGKHIDGKESNPGTLNHHLSTHHGYQGNLFIWGSVSSFGLSYHGQITDHEAIKHAVSAGKIVLLNVHKGRHWVLATGVNGNTYSVNDPGFSTTHYTTSEVVRAGIYTH